MKLVVVLCVVVGMLAGAGWCEEKFFSAADAAGVAQRVAGSLVVGSAEVGAGAEAVVALGGKVPGGVCGKVAKVGAEAPVQVLAAAVQAGKAAGCKGMGGKAIVKALGAGLKSEAVADVAAAVLGLEAVGKASGDRGVAALLAFADEDGTFRESVNDEFGSLAATGVVFPALAAAVASATSKSEAALGDYGAGLEDLFALAEASADGSGKSFYDVDAPSVDPLVTTGSILGSIEAVAAACGAPVPVSSGDVAAFAAYVLSRKAVSDGVAARALVDGLAFVESNSIGVPLVISVVRGSVTLAAKGDDGSVLVSVTDVRGGAVKGAKVTLVGGAGLAAGSTVRFANQALKAVSGSPGVFALPLVASKPAPGYYRLTLEATAGKNAVGATAVVDAKVTTPAELKSCSVEVVQDSVGGTEKATYACKAGQPVTDLIVVDASNELDLSFAVRSSATRKAIEPHQVFLRFVHADTGVDTVFVVPTPESGPHKVTVAFGAAADEFGSVSGRYTAEVVVGDAFIDAAIVWDLGVFDISFGADAAPAPALASGPLPDIAHQFRQPESHPPAIISLVFAAAAGAPLVLLLGLLGKLGANVANFPTSQPLMLYAVAFHASIAAIALLYLTYWLQLNMFETLGYLAVLGAVATFSGKSLLSNHTAFRLSGVHMKAE